MNAATLDVTLPDGSVRRLPAGSTGLDLAQAIGSRLAKAALAAVVDGNEVDISVPLRNGAQVAIITADSDAGRHVLRHSTAHVLAQAVLQHFPGAKFTIGPAIEDGFYYDFELPDGKTFSDNELEAITERMRAIVKADQPFVRSEMSAAEALALFVDQPYKCEIIERVTTGAADGSDASEVAGDGSVSVYRNTESFVDLCRGPHVPSTARLGHFALMKVAGAYWRGNEKGPMLQRIYGTAWESKAALEEHITRIAEAEKRDHRRLATEMDLLSFPSELGGGLAVWHPKGAIVRKIMEDYSRYRHQNGGYQFVFTPHIANAQLFETSGHLLPLRLFELGTVYRYERAGTLHGLLRIRGFTQDDSHIFCTEDQMADEITSLLDFVLSVLRQFGFEDFEFKLSTRDLEKSVGSDEIWEKATTALREALNRHGVKYSVKEGDAAFYGPKIDIDVRDAIGRKWQLSTIQCDFNLPERFGLEYIGSDNSRHRPIMLHRALFGSVERFFGVLLEHYGGAFPAWLAPVQVRVLAVTSQHEEYAQSLVKRMRAEGFRVDTAEADEQLGKRIRSAKLERIPFVLVVGDDDVKNSTVGVNPRGGDVIRDVKVDAFIAQLHDDTRTEASAGNL
jgi:threonyl-tRNA synthetase